MDLQGFKTETLAIQLSCKVKNYCLVKEREILDRLNSEILLKYKPNRFCMCKVSSLFHHGYETLN